MSAIQNSGRLDADRLRRVVESKTVGEAFKVLGDYGYAYADGLSVDGFIVNETNRLIGFVSDCAPSKTLADALLARFMYNNVKLAYKSRFGVSDGGYYDIDMDIGAIASGDYSGVDKYSERALVALDEAGEKRPQTIDYALTNAMYGFLRGIKIPIVQKYVVAEIDMKNILSAARMKRLSITGNEFIDGGKIDAEILEEARTSEHFAEFFENTPYRAYAENIETDGFAELWRAERDADDYLYYISGGDIAEFSSYKPFLHYYTETLIELKTVKTALVCVKTNSRDTFYARMPKLYA